VWATTRTGSPGPSAGPPVTTEAAVMAKVS
jgi:hypothetical protein